MLKKATEEKKTQAILVPAMKIMVCDFTLIGLTPLLCHNFDEKTQRQIVEGQTGAAKTATREPKNPVEQFAASLYVWPGTECVIVDESEGYDYKAHAIGRFCFPTVAFKKAAVRAATDVGVAMTDMRRAFQIDEEYVEIVGSNPILDRRPVRLNKGPWDIRFRGLFEEWRVVLRLEINGGVFRDPMQIWHLFRSAGFSTGVGEYRPEKDGRFGRFTAGDITHIETREDAPTVIVSK